MADETLDEKKARLTRELEATNQQIEDNKKTAGATTGDEKKPEIEGKKPQAPVRAVI